MKISMPQVDFLSITQGGAPSSDSMDRAAATTGVPSGLLQEDRSTSERCGTKVWWVYKIVGGNAAAQDRSYCNA